MKSVFATPPEGRPLWVILLVGVGLIQLLTIALGVSIREEWHIPKFILLAVALVFINGFTTGLYVLVTLISAKFPDDLSEAHARRDPVHVLEPRKPQKDNFAGTRPVAA
jgi:energy-coupling factor transporter transmembrane protein EcfT